MPSIFIAFHEDGVVRDVSAQSQTGYLAAPETSTSTLALRYALQDGQVVDLFPDQSDEDVLVEIAANHTKSALKPTSRFIGKLEFLGRFTDTELAAIYASAKDDVLVEIWMDKLRLVSEVDLQDSRTIAGVMAMEAAGLLASGRGEQILF